MLILSTGSVTNEAIKADALLQTMGIEVSVVAIPILKPLAFNEDLLGQFDNVLVLEEHSQSGGLGTIIAEQLAMNGIRTNLVKLGLPDQVHHELGSQAHLRTYFNLDAQGIVETVKEMLGS